MSYIKAPKEQELTEQNVRLISALQGVSGLWPMPPHCAEINPKWVGPNDGKMRAILLEGAIEIARNALKKEGLL
jgi:hypothetical protein